MKIKIVGMDGKEITCDVKSFEARMNQVSNWVRLELTDGGTLTIHRVATFKTDTTN